MRNAMLWMMVLPVALTVAGCRDRGADEDAKEAAEPPAESRQARAPARRAAPAAPAAEAPAEGASGSAPALRFDMTSQEGELQTAEDFDAWMKAQGVRVAEGRPTGPEAPPAAAQPQPGAARD
ncbi:hypothetical protein LDO32_06455 [Luteimonas sp. Y-2-2-4F]|nr:hypothetical protein [Luteimonas sp. Y-2-2-4F]MCD9031367.1 hypothetical protein [Luteimonas sp. Y-2-2-4F]